MGSLFLWQFIPVRDYSNAERTSVATGFTPLLVNLESMITKSRTGESSKNCAAWKVEKAAHYFVHTDKVIPESSMD